MTERRYKVRDPIHGLIEFSEPERRLINTKVFQRLRRIRQLAMAFLAYPSALHTRFEHSIGVMHIAGRICTELKKVDSNKVTNADVDRVRFAALLHDVGHGPFSHVSESLLEKYASEHPLPDQIREKIHEQITVDIIRTDCEISNILSHEERELVIDLIQSKETSSWQRDIVSSELDADKMDYLLRDSYFAGVKYGEYDLEKLIESCRIYVEQTSASLAVEQTDTSLAVSNEGIYALEQLLLARYHMTQQVYWHKVSLISAQMIVRGITLAIEGNNTQMKELYQYTENDKEKFVQNYLKYHDEKVIDILKSCEPKNCKEKLACEIFNRLYERKLFKMIAELPLTQKSESNSSVRKRLVKMEPDQKQQWEKNIASYLGINADLVIVNKRQIRIPNYGSRSNILDPEAITIFDEKQKEPRDLSYYTSELTFARPSSDDEASLEIVQVYASPDDWNQSAKKQSQTELEIYIQDILRTA